MYKDSPTSSACFRSHFLPLPFLPLGTETRLAFNSSITLLVDWSDLVEIAELLGLRRRKFGNAAPFVRDL
jgi:hypothetical protein